MAPITNIKFWHGGSPWEFLLFGFQQFGFQFGFHTAGSKNEDARRHPKSSSLPFLPPYSIAQNIEIHEVYSPLSFTTWQKSPHNIALGNTGRPHRKLVQTQVRRLSTAGIFCCVMRKKWSECGGYGCVLQWELLFHDRPWDRRCRPTPKWPWGNIQ